MINLFLIVTIIDFVLIYIDGVSQNNLSCKSLFFS